MPLLLIFLVPLALGAVVFGGSCLSADEAVLRDVLRVSGRLSFLLFWPVLMASPMQRAWPGRVTSWLKRRRRSFGVAFAGMHTFHAIILVRLMTSTDFRPTLMVALAGGTGFILIWALFATSFPRTAQMLGSRRWQILHRVGLHGIASVFAYDFLFRTVLYASRGEDVIAYVPFGGMLLAAYGLRAVQAVQARSRVSRPAPVRAQPAAA